MPLIYFAFDFIGALALTTIEICFYRSKSYDVYITKCTLLELAQIDISVKMLDSINDDKRRSDNLSKDLPSAVGINNVK